MSHVLLFDLDQNRRRLEYYLNLKASYTPPLPTHRAKTPKETAIDKWIEIYEERVRKLEKQVGKLGLRTQPMSANASHGAAQSAQTA